MVNNLLWDKTPSLSDTVFVINIVVVFVIFSKSLFQFIIFPRFPVLSEGVGEREHLEWV